jgi:alkaline phosphatase D
MRYPIFKFISDIPFQLPRTLIDHDFGCNNADRTYEFKYESGLAFVDFLDEPEISPMRQRAQAGHGVYGVKVFDFARPRGHQELSEGEAGIDVDVALGPPSNLYSNQTVAIFVLDVRTSKTPWKKGSDRYGPDYEGDFLGERQWQWFENSIRRSRATVNVIVNGLQVHAQRFPDGNVAESWAQYPRAQQRLFDAVLQDSVESPILVSGDVHMAQLMRKDCARKGEHRARRSLVEMTTR